MLTVDKPTELSEDRIVAWAQLCEIEPGLLRLEEHLRRFARRTANDPTCESTPIGIGTSSRYCAVLLVSVER